MAGPAPKTRNWWALENAHKPKGRHVLVFGQVRVSATNMEPRLTETPERNPKNLGLNLTIETSGGAGADVMVWKSAHFHKEVKANEYDDVVVRWEIGQIANFPIRDDREHAADAAAAMKALNEQHTGKGGPKPAKPAGTKPSAKKTAAKKKLAAKKKSAAKKKPRAVGGWAKGKKAKKVPKKASKKKAAKKTKAAKKKRR
jgi:hypothetical protein